MPTPRPRLLALLAALTLALPALADPPAAPKPADPTKKPDPKPAPPTTKPADPTLKLGDKAPSLNAESIKGDLIPGIQPGKVYIIEFWATWCPSCRETLPKLKKLAKSSKDLTIIAIASSEKAPEKNADDKRLEGVQRFVNDRTEQMPYPVVFDGPRTIAADWLIAAHPALPRYLPFAFVIDSTQTIIWIGDPRKPDFDAAIEKALKPLAPPPPPKADPKRADPKKTDKPKSRDPKPKG